MSNTGSARALAILSLALLVTLVPDERVHYFVMASLGFCHYALAMHYSRRRLVQVLSHPLSAAAFAVVLLFGTMCFMASYSILENSFFKLILYFGIHHVFNEEHFSRRELATFKLDAPQVRPACMLLHACAYLLIISKDNQMAGFSPDQLLIATGAAAGLYLVTLLVTSGGARLGRLLAATWFEGLAVVVALLVYYTPLVVRFTDVVFFHFVFWALQSVPKLRQAGHGALTRYAVATVGLTAFAVAISPMGFFSAEAADGTYFHALFVFGSYFHITVSFALSSAQPDFITRWFSAAASSPARAHGARTA